MIVVLPNDCFAVVGLLCPAGLYHQYLCIYHSPLNEADFVFVHPGCLLVFFCNVLILYVLNFAPTCSIGEMDHLLNNKHTCSSSFLFFLLLISYIVKIIDIHHFAVGRFLVTYHLARAWLVCVLVIYFNYTLFCTFPCCNRMLLLIIPDHLCLLNNLTTGCLGHYQTESILQCAPYLT